MIRELLLTFMIGTLVSALPHGKDIEDLIKDVFGEQSSENPTDKNPPNPRETEEDCTCVPYYQCANGTILTDGTGLLDIRAKAGACEDYMEVCCKDPLDEEHAIKPTPTKRVGCGQRHPEGVGFRITGDKDNEAQFGEFPWMVAILKKSRRNGQEVLVYQCGGALIHESVVLTAAHCVKTHTSNDLIIRAGEWDTQRASEVFPHQDENIVQIIVHPKFNSGNLRYDYGLLILEKPVKLGDNVDTVCVPNPGPVRLSTECYASGWGKDEYGESGKSQVILKKIDLPIVPKDQCVALLRETRLGKYYKLHESFVCAGGVPGKDTCKGDGGSPLVCPIEGRQGIYEVTGIVSWGVGCGGETPGIYADVAYARPWIDLNLEKYGIQLE